MGTCKIVNLTFTVIALILSLIIYIKVNRKSSENFKNVAVGDCAYGLGGNNIALCNEWLNNYRNGNPCYSGCDMLSCKQALGCCNYLGTCDQGKKCEGSSDPLKNKNSKYDKDYYTDF